MRFARHQSAFVGASVLTVASFLGATAYSQSRLSALDALSSTIATDALPSIHLLGRGGVRLQRLRRLLHDGVTAGASRAELATATAELNALEEEMARYLLLRPLAGEGDLLEAIRRDVGSTSSEVRAIVQALERDDGASAKTLLETRLDPALERATRTMLAAMEYDVNETEQLARDVQAVRRATTTNIILLDVLATVVAGISAFFALRAARQHQGLLQQHNALLTERVTELDRFAGRAAHDILSPLNTVALGLSLVARAAEGSVSRYVESSQRALQRVRQLVEGLLQFARSGAQAEGGARSRVDVVLATVAADCADAAQASEIELTVDAPQQWEAACSIGVLTSVVQNLVLNAIKYMGPQSLRRVALRARGAREQVRIEVEDTGPGVPPEMQTRIFEPFVRGRPDHEVEGLGLGLATVKRLVQAHGGTMGMESTVGVGTTFWVELPQPSSRPLTNDGPDRQP